MAYIEPSDYEFAKAEMLGEPFIPDYESVSIGDRVVMERHGKIVMLHWADGSDELPFDTIDRAHSFVTRYCKGAGKTVRRFETDGEPG